MYRSLVLVSLLVACGQPVHDVLTVTELPQDDFAVSPMMLYPTADGVTGRACAWSVEQVKGDARELVRNRFAQAGELVLPSGQRFTSAASFLAWLDGAAPDQAELGVLALNQALNRAGVYGAYAAFDRSFTTTGDVAGKRAAEILTEAAVAPGKAHVSAAAALNNGFQGCPVEWFTVALEDLDFDGIPAEADCDDSDATVGLSLYRSDFSSPESDWSTTPQLGGNWTHQDGSILVNEGGQQALLNTALSHGNVRIQAGISAMGTEPGCGFDCAECEEYDPGDCYSEADAIALGILRATVTAIGEVTWTNTGAHDVCLNGDVMWDNPGSQAVFVSQPGGGSLDVRVPAGGSKTLYYGTWTTNNGVYSPALGEDAFWCYQEGTLMAVGAELYSLGAITPDPLVDLIAGASDTDGDGVEDAVDWVNGLGVQDQYNIWSFQAANALLVVGKQAQDNGDGSVRVALTVQNRGAVDGAGILFDTVPALWTVLSCSEEPQVAENADGSTSLSWPVSLGGCTDGCSVVPETTITCDIQSVLQVDRDRVELPAAQVEHEVSDGSFLTNASLPAVLFGYDRDGDGKLSCGQIDRWRGGILGRAAFDEDQDEGYHGYRCAIARNAEEDCADPGWFVQLGEFLDAPEDSISSECEDGCPPNTTFESLGRKDTSAAFDLPTGASAVLSLTMLSDNLTCEATTSTGSKASVWASDTSFDKGTIGLSTLNLWGVYDWLEVCEVHEEVTVIIIGD